MAVPVNPRSGSDFQLRNLTTSRLMRFLDSPLRYLPIILPSSTVPASWPVPTTRVGLFVLRAPIVSVGLLSGSAARAGFAHGGYLALMLRTALGGLLPADPAGVGGYGPFDMSRADSLQFRLSTDWGWDRLDNLGRTVTMVRRCRASRTS